MKNLSFSIHVYHSWPFGHINLDKNYHPVNKQFSFEAHSIKIWLIFQNAFTTPQKKLDIYYFAVLFSLPCSRWTWKHQHPVYVVFHHLLTIDYMIHIFPPPLHTSDSKRRPMKWDPPSMCPELQGLVYVLRLSQDGAFFFHDAAIGRLSWVCKAVSVTEEVEGFFLFGLVTQRGLQRSIKAPYFACCDKH